MNTPIINRDKNLKKIEKQLINKLSLWWGESVLMQNYA